MRRWILPTGSDRLLLRLVRMVYRTPRSSRGYTARVAEKGLLRGHPQVRVYEIAVEREAERYYGPD